VVWNLDVASENIFQDLYGWKLCTTNGDSQLSNAKSLT